MLDMSKINAAMTEKVVEYINKGFVIDIDSMDSSQSYGRRVALTDGKKIVRIFIGYGYDDELHHNTTEIVVGEYSIQDKRFGVVFDDRLTIIDKAVFCIVKRKSGDMVMCTKEETEAIVKKRAARRSYHEMTNTRDLGESYKKAILPLIRRRFRGMKTAKVSDITSCFVVTGNHRDLHEYHVICRDKLFTF